MLTSSAALGAPSTRYSPGIATASKAPPRKSPVGLNARFRILSSETLSGRAYRFQGSAPCVPTSYIIINDWSVIYWAKVPSQRKPKEEKGPAAERDETARWRRRKDARPQEILEAALAVFAEKGFAAARMDDIALRARVSKGTIYL